MLIKNREPRVMGCSPWRLPFPLRASAGMANMSIPSLIFPTIHDILGPTCGTIAHRFACSRHALFLFFAACCSSPMSPTVVLASPRTPLPLPITHNGSPSLPRLPASSPSSSPLLSLRTQSCLPGFADCAALLSSLAFSSLLLFICAGLHRAAVVAPLGQPHFISSLPSLSTLSLPLLKFLSLSLFARHCSSPQCLVRWPALLHLSTSLPSCPVLHSRHRHGQPPAFRCFARVPFARRSPASRCSFCRHCAALSDWSLLAVGVCVLVVGTVVILVCAGCCRSCGSTRRSVRSRSLLLAYPCSCVL